VNWDRALGVSSPFVAKYRARFGSASTSTLFSSWRPLGVQIPSQYAPSRPRAVTTLAPPCDPAEEPAASRHGAQLVAAKPRPPKPGAGLRTLARRYAQDRMGSWHVLHDSVFRTYFVGSTISNLGTWLQNTAQMLVAYQFTHSVLDVAIVTSAQFSGFLTIGPWAGGLAERMGRKKVLVGAQLLSAVVTACLALLEFTGRLTEGELVVGALVTGLGLTFALPVQTAMLSVLVPERDRRAALAMNSVSYNAGRTLAPLLCLAVLASIGTWWVFALNSASFVVFAVIVVRVYPQDGIAQQKRIKARAIWSIAFYRPRIMLLLTMVAAVTFADDPVLVLGPSLARHLGIPSFWPAYFLAALGIGTVFGALFPTRPPTTRLAAIPLGLLGISVLIFAMGFSGTVSLAAAVAAGITGLLAGSASQALLLRWATPEHALHVMALWGVAWAGTKPVASLLDGLLASHIGVGWTAVVLALPAVSIAMAEICLSERWKQRLKDRMSQLNGTAGLRQPQSAT
jgi:predicted MFS family arabinose efflux permease